MRCASCNRPIFAAPAATINSRGGALHYGPVCSKRMGLTTTAGSRRSHTHRPSQKAADNPDQMEMFGMLAQPGEPQSPGEIRP